MQQSHRWTIAPHVRVNPALMRKQHQGNFFLVPIPAVARSIPVTRDPATKLGILSGYNHQKKLRTVTTLEVANRRERGNFISKQS